MRRCVSTHRDTRPVHRMAAVSLCVALLVFLAACGDKVDPILEFDAGSAEDGEAVTYIEDVRPLLETHCLLCHSQSKQGFERNGAPININFDTYDGILAWIDQASQRIQSGTMPPTGGIPEDERMLFQRWVDTGFPE